MSDDLDGFETPKTKFPLIPNIINGGIAGIIGVSCTFPLDLVKTRLQNQQSGPGVTRAYSSMYDCLRKTYAAEGVRGIYRGLAVSILLVTPEKAINLSANDYFRHHIKEKQSTEQLSWPAQMLAGGMAGMLQIIVTTPMELLKIQMQNAGRVQGATTSTAASPLSAETTTTTATKSTHNAKSQLTAMSLSIQLVREKGILGLYKGIGPTGLRDVCFSLVYFPVFAELHILGPRKGDGSGGAVFWYNFIAGLIAGSIAAVSVTPIDVVKTRLQTLRKAAGEQEFDGMLDCFHKTLRSEGPMAFFKGGLCRMVVIAPLFGIAQMIYLMGVAQKLLALRTEDE